MNTSVTPRLFILTMVEGQTAPEMTLQGVAVFHVGGTQGVSLKVAKNGAIGHYAVKIKDKGGDLGEKGFDSSHGKVVFMPQK